MTAVDMVSLGTVAAAFAAALSSGILGWTLARARTEYEIKRQLDQGFRIIRHRLANEAAVKQAEEHLAEKARSGR